MTEIDWTKTLELSDGRSAELVATGEFMNDQYPWLIKIHCDGEASLAIVRRTDLKIIEWTDSPQSPEALSSDKRVVGPSPAMIERVMWGPVDSDGRIISSRSLSPDEETARYRCQHDQELLDEEYFIARIAWKAPAPEPEADPEMWHIIFRGQEDEYLQLNQTRYAVGSNGADDARRRLSHGQYTEAYVARLEPVTKDEADD